MNPKNNFDGSMILSVIVYACLILVLTEIFHLGIAVRSFIFLGCFFFAFLGVPPFHQILGMIYTFIHYLRSNFF